jgi:hypothetical protein
MKKPFWPSLAQWAVIVTLILLTLIVICLALQVNAGPE